MFAVLDENANSMISKEEFAAVTAVLRRRLRRVSHVQRTGLDTSSGGCASCTFCFACLPPLEIHRLVASTLRLWPQ